MGQLTNEDWEQTDIAAIISSTERSGVISGLEITESSPAGMSILVAAGNCDIDGAVYEEGSGQNVNISNGDATHPRKDIIVYDATAGNPAVVAGTPAAAPHPPNIPAGDIYLAMVAVAANESTSIVNADITNGRVNVDVKTPIRAVSASDTALDADEVITVSASGGVRTITLPPAAGIQGKVYTVKKTDSSTNTVTIDGNAAETIDGAATFVLNSENESVIIISDGSNWQRLIANHAHSHGSDGDDIPNIGSHVNVFAGAFPVVGQGNWIVQRNANAYFNMAWINFSYANLDNSTTKTWIPAGTYTLYCYVTKGPNCGILDIDIEGSEKASFDLYYSYAGAAILESQAGIVITTSGLKDLRIRVDGKNASSSSYLVQVSAISMVRTA